MTDRATTNQPNPAEMRFALAGIVVAVFIVARMSTRRARGTSGCGGCTGCCEPAKSSSRLPALCCLALAWPITAQAADTVETWDPGAVDVDVYLGYDGVGKRSRERAVFGELMLGYGIVDRFSAYLGANLSVRDTFGQAKSSLFLGGFGTVLDTDHVDVDLFLNLAAPDSGFEVTPSFELNLDADPEMRSFGVYLRAGVRGNFDGSGATVAVGVNPGAYVSPLPAHQLFLEYDFTVSPDVSDVEHGAVAVGYNVVLSRAIELVTQVAVDVPATGERAAVNFMTGFIATIEGAVPTAGSQRSARQEPEAGFFVCL